MFSTGIENSYPTIQVNGQRQRVDEMESCGHYDRWRDDFALVRELGIEFLRYGPPYYRAHVGPGRYDWAFADETFAALREREIAPIADLCHFGVPDWIGDFQNPDWPPLFAEYARAFAERFPWVKYYTPVNEIFIAALFSAQYGWWNECLSSDRSFVAALEHLCRANTLAMRAILSVQPGAIFIQFVSSEYFDAEHPHSQKRAAFLNKKRFLSLDLTYGHSVDVEMYEYLIDNGMTRAQYHWFGDNHVKSHCIMGNDYYITNEHLVRRDGTTRAAGEIFGYYVITHQYFSRYHLPVMHTETNIAGDDKSPRWLWRQFANVNRLREDGVPIVGFTWYSLNDQIDWNTALREPNGFVCPVGLTTLDREIRPVGHSYRRLIDQWRNIMPTQSHGVGLAL
jgi:beta-glucosidase/6-phospho-beta-glucosidase/beta-galactosidase